MKNINAIKSRFENCKRSNHLTDEDLTEMTVLEFRHIRNSGDLTTAYAIFHLKEKGLSFKSVAETDIKSLNREARIKYYSGIRLSQMLKKLPKIKELAEQIELGEYPVPLNSRAITDVERLRNIKKAISCNYGVSLLNKYKIPTNEYGKFLEPFNEIEKQIDNILKTLMINNPSI